MNYLVYILDFKKSYSLFIYFDQAIDGDYTIVTFSDNTRVEDTSNFC